MWCWIHPKYITCSQFYHPKTGSFSALSAFGLEFGVPEWLGFLNHPLIWGCHTWKSSNVCCKDPFLSSIVTWVRKTQPAYNKLVENAWLPNFGACHVFTPKDFQNIPEPGATFHHFPGRWAARFNPYVSEARWKNSESASNRFRWNCFLGRLHHWPTKIAGLTRETMQSGWFNQQTEDILG